MPRLAILLNTLLVIFLTSCGQQEDNPTTEPGAAGPTTSQQAPGEVNIYSHRHYQADKELFAEFTEQTGITVNVTKAKADELIQRLKVEGDQTEADLLITVDAGRLGRAKSMGLLQPVTSRILTSTIPENFREKDGHWFGLTMRARIVVYAKDRVKPNQLSSYENLADPVWKGKILIRSSQNEYNQSLMAAIIAHKGKGYAKKWAEGVVANMARSPQGNDRDQVKAIIEGEGDLAVINTYYLGLLLNSQNPEEQKVGQSVAIFFPSLNKGGTHVNVSGAGVTKHAKNKANAVKLLEFLVSKSSQKKFAEANYEYPVNADVTWSDLLKSWGTFTPDSLNLSELGVHGQDAAIVFDQAGWK
jgi:iron(III) transport system substrate-binding protein